MTPDGLWQTWPSQQMSPQGSGFRGFRFRGAGPLTHLDLAVD